MTSIPEKIRLKGVNYKCRGNSSITNTLFEDTKANGLKFNDLSPILIKNIGFNIIYKAFRCFHQTLSFDKLQKQFPNLSSIREFLTSSNYLGDYPITFYVLKNNSPNNEDKLNACKLVLQEISNYVQTIEVTYKGSKKFYSKPIREVFTDRIRNITREKDDESWGVGISQADSLVKPEYQIDLSNKDWYAYNDNFGTSEEKKFVKYFSTKIEQLKTIFNNIYLIRNEIQVGIYSFDDGSKFEPDYVLILTKNNEESKKNNLYICMFIEPKGEHLLQKDEWKNNLLLDLSIKGIPIVKFVDDNEYKIWGTPLYNESITKSEFNTYFDKFINSTRKK